jgi:ATP-dependent DNA ligase
MARADGGNSDAGAVQRPEWVFERKFDGIRLLAYKKGDDVQFVLA